MAREYNIGRANRIAEAGLYSERSYQARQDLLSLWKIYKNGAPPNVKLEVRNILIERHLYLVKFEAERMKLRLPECVDVEDLISAGIFGLNDAISGYDLSRRVKFKVYCSHRIRGAMIDYLRKMDWVSRKVRSRANTISKLRIRLQKEFDRLPRDDEIADRMGISLKEFDEADCAEESGDILSLDSILENDDGEHHTDGIADRSVPETLGRVYRNEFVDAITTDSSLTRREGLIIKFYYLHQMTMKQIGKALGITESRVNQIHSAVIDKLRRRYASRKEEFCFG